MLENCTGMQKAQYGCTGNMAGIGRKYESEVGCLWRGMTNTIYLKKAASKVSQTTLKA